MKYLLSLMLGVGTLFSANVADAGTQNDCFSCDSFNFCDLKTNVYVDYLYWQPCRTDLDYSTGESGVRRHVNPEYNSGYRIGGNIQRGCWDLGVRYTSFCNTDTRNPVFDGMEFGEVKYKIDLNVVDIEVGHEFALGNCCSLDFRSFVGVKLAWLDEVFDISDQMEGAKAELDFKGYGLYLGTEIQWDICSWNTCNINMPLALVTRGSVGVLRVNTHSKDDDNITLTDRGDRCSYAPVLEGYVGLQVTFEGLCGCRGDRNNDAYLQIGYEVQSWGDIRRFADDDKNSAFGMGGLVTRVGFNF